MTTPDSPGERVVPWYRWYSQARERCKEFDLRRVPRDAYREHWLMGSSVEEAVRQIRLQHDPTLYRGAARGDHR